MVGAALLHSPPMDRRMLLGAYRFGFAILTLIAITAQALDLNARGIFMPANFLSYFTIQSNLIAIGVFLVGAARWRAVPTATWDLVRGAAVVYVTITLIVFALLLSNTDVDTALPWVDIVVHRVMPIAVMIDWMVDPPTGRISFSASLRWLIFPLVWTGYTLVRGALVGWYPYPFLDPGNGGYVTVAAYVVGVLVLGVVLCGVIAVVGNTLRDRRTAREESAAA
jgi:hypothetical protein